MMNELIANISNNIVEADRIILENIEKMIKTLTILRDEYNNKGRELIR